MMDIKMCTVQSVEGGAAIVLLDGAQPGNEIRALTANNYRAVAGDRAALVRIGGQYIAMWSVGPYRE